MKKFVSILVSMVLILMAATTTAFAATTDMEVRLSEVKDGKILAEKQSDYGDWFYVVVLGEKWGDWDEEDDEWMSDDEWTQFWDDLWEEEVLTGKSFMV